MPSAPVNKDPTVYTLFSLRAEKRAVGLWVDAMSGSDDLTKHDYFDDFPPLLIITSTVVLAISVVLYFYYFHYSATSSRAKTKKTTVKSRTNQARGKPCRSTSSEKTVEQQQSSEEQAKPPPTTKPHHWLKTTLKGHGGQVLDFHFSNNGKYLASCSNDRSLIAWHCEDFSKKTTSRFIRTNVEWHSDTEYFPANSITEYATKIKWTPDNRAFIISKHEDNTIQYYRVGRNEDGILNSITPANSFPKKFEQEIFAIDMSCNGRFIMTAYADANVTVWNPKGEILSSFPTRQITLTAAKISLCGRYIATTGFTSDVKVWSVVFHPETNSFKHVIQTFVLNGHTASVLNLAFNNDSSRICSVSKDGSWKMWDTKVNEQTKLDASIVTSAKIPNKYKLCSLIAIDPEAKTVALANSRDILVFSAISGVLEEAIEYQVSDDITALSFDLTGNYLLSTGGKAIHVYHNVTGHRATIAALEKKIKDRNSTESLRARLQLDIDDIKKTLNTIKVKK